MDQWEIEWQTLQNQQSNNTPNFPEYDFDYGGGTSESYNAPSYNAPSYDYAYDIPSYREPTYDYGLPSYRDASYNTATLQTNAPWWQAPTSVNSMGMGPEQSFGGYSATMQAGSGPTNIGATTFAGPNTTITTAPSSNAAGGLGVDPRKYQLGNNSPALLESASTTGANRQLSNMAFDQSQENESSRGVRDWVRDPENRDTVRLGIQGLGALAGLKAQRDAGKIAKEQMGLQAQNMAAQRAAYEREMALREEAMASQRQALGQNQQMAQRANQESVRSFDEARSLYNPQELGIRGMAQQRGTTQRSVEDTRRTLASRGLSAAAIEAEVRRQRLAGATNETTAYMRGLDTGRSAQAGALSSAKALGSTMPGLSYSQGPNAPTFTPNYSGADFYAKQGADNSKALRDLLESYADYPTLRAQEEARRDMQRRSNT